MLLPVLGFVNIGFMSYSLVADHWQYFAMIGPIVGGAALLVSKSSARVRPSSAETDCRGRREESFGADAAFEGTPHVVPGKRWKISTPMAAIALLLLFMLGALTWSQSRIYANGERFWRASIAANPDCPAAHLSLGVILLRKGATDEASDQFQEALRLKPDYAEAHNSLGQILAEKGSLVEAIGHYEQALKRIPYTAAVHFNLAAAFLRAGKTDEIISEYQTALRLRNDPHYAPYNPGIPLGRDPRFFADAHYNLANALLKKNRLAEAIAQYQQALQYEAGDVDTHRNLGVAFLMDRKLDDALGQFQEAVQLAPGLADAHYQLGDAYARNGEMAKASGEFQSVLRLNPNNAQARQRLEEILQKPAQAP